MEAATPERLAALDSSGGGGDAASAADSAGGGGDADAVSPAFEAAVTGGSDGGGAGTTAAAAAAASADVWYNVGQVAVGIGDLGLAYQAFKIAISVDHSHAESYSNLGVLEGRKGNVNAAQANYRTARELAPHLFEPCFNGALLAYKTGDFQEAFALATQALERNEGHHDSLELLKQLKTHFNML